MKMNLPSPARVTRPDKLPRLVPGERLDQKTFHARYEAMPPGTRAELIGGVVYMPSPVSWLHGQFHMRLSHWLQEYADATPGTECFDAASTILGPRSEPQPDLSLLIFPQGGGQTAKQGQYIKGAPELIAEVALSTEEYDLQTKKQDYERSGVREYLVVALRQQKVFWFALRRKKLRDLPLGSDGIFRSAVLPGLWLDPAALLKLNRRRILAVLKQGLASGEHAAFVARLARR
jgi:Uma2 family endonuclease